MGHPERRHGQLRDPGPRSRHLRHGSARDPRRHGPRLRSPRLRRPEPHDSRSRPPQGQRLLQPAVSSGRMQRPRRWNQSRHAHVGINRRRRWRLACVQRRRERIERYDRSARRPGIRRVPGDARPLRGWQLDQFQLRHRPLADGQGSKLLDSLRQLGKLLQCVHPRIRRHGPVHLEQPGLPRRLRGRELRRGRLRTCRSPHDEPVRGSEERDRGRRHVQRDGPGGCRGLQQPRAVRRWPDQARCHGARGIRMVGPRRRPVRRRHELLPVERHEHGHTDDRGSRDPGPAVFHGRMVPDG